MANTYIHKEKAKWRSGIIDLTFRLKKNFDKINLQEMINRRQKLNEKVIDDELKRWKNTREVDSWIGLFFDEE